jgi:hypothetical protein
MDEKIYTVEPKTADRVQDEPWYSDYQMVCKVLCAGPYPRRQRPYYFERLPNGLDLALVACKKCFKKFPGPPGWQPPDDERLLRWIKAAWLSEEEIDVVDEYYKKRYGY